MVEMFTCALIVGQPTVISSRPFQSLYLSAEEMSNVCDNIECVRQIKIIVFDSKMCGDIIYRLCKRHNEK